MASVTTDKSRAAAAAVATSGVADVLRDVLRMRRRCRQQQQQQQRRPRQSSSVSPRRKRHRGNDAANAGANDDDDDDDDARASLADVAADVSAACVPQRHRTRRADRDALPALLQAALTSSPLSSHGKAHARPRSDRNKQQQQQQQHKDRSSHAVAVGDGAAATPLYLDVSPAHRQRRRDTAAAVVTRCGVKRARSASLADAGARAQTTHAVTPHTTRASRCSRDEHGSRARDHHGGGGAAAAVSRTLAARQLSVRARATTTASTNTTTTTAAAAAAATRATAATAATTTARRRRWTRARLRACQLGCTRAAALLRFWRAAWRSDDDDDGDATALCAHARLDDTLPRRRRQRALRRALPTRAATAVVAADADAVATRQLWSLVHTIVQTRQAAVQRLSSYASCRYHRNQDGEKGGGAACAVSLRAARAFPLFGLLVELLWLRRVGHGTRHNDDNDNDNKRRRRRQGHGGVVHATVVSRRCGVVVHETRLSIGVVVAAHDADQNNNNNNNNNNNDDDDDATRCARFASTLHSATAGDTDGGCCGTRATPCVVVVVRKLFPASSACEADALRALTRQQALPRRRRRRLRRDGTAATTDASSSSSLPCLVRVLGEVPMLATHGTAAQAASLTSMTSSCCLDCLRGRFL